MENDKTLKIVVIVVFLIAIVIAVYFLFFKKEEDEDLSFPPPSDDISDDTLEPGFQTLRLDKTVRNKKSIGFPLNTRYYTTALSGTFRMGGTFGADVKIKYRKNGRWREIARVSGEAQRFKQFACFINDYCDGIKFEAEQGRVPWIGDRYIDEVHGQLMVEVG